MKQSFALGVAAIASAQVIVFGMHFAKKERKKESEVTIGLPEWAESYYDSLQAETFITEEEMMKIAVELSRLNVVNNTGGPFGCAIFEVADGEGKLFSVGVNQVVPLGNSTLHAEMVAIQFAQKKMQAFSLKDENKKKEYHLYTSCEPCAMCLGGTLWSGVCKLACSATKDDAEAIGFNEGPVFPESYNRLEEAGVQVVRNILHKEGSKVLQTYGQTGLIYNA